MEVLDLHAQTGQVCLWAPGTGPGCCLQGPTPSPLPPAVPQQATAAPPSPPSTYDQAKVFCFRAGPTGEGSSGAGRQQLCTSMILAGAASSGFPLAPGVPICCGTLLQPCLKSTALQGHLCSLWAIEGSAAGPVSCVCSNKLSSARAHHWTWLFTLLNYWNALWLAFGQVVLSQMILRHSPRCWLTPGTAPKCDVAAANLFYRVREFNSMDIGCSMPFGLSVREQLQAGFIQKSRHGFWVQIFFLPIVEHELKILVHLMQTVGGGFSSFLFFPEISVLFTLNIFFLQLLILLFCV